MAARTCRLVSCPSCSYASSGRPGAAPSRRASGSRRQSTATTFSGSPGGWSQPSAVPSAAVRSPPAAELFEHPQPARAEAAVAQQPGDLGRGGRTGAEHQQPSAVVQRGGEPGGGPPDQRDDLGVLDGPAEPGAGVGDGRRVRQDAERVGAEYVRQRAADAVEHRVAAGQHGDAGGRRGPRAAAGTAGRSGEGQGTRSAAHSAGQQGQLTRSADHRVRGQQRRPASRRASPAQPSAPIPTTVTLVGAGVTGSGTSGSAGERPSHSTDLVRGPRGPGWAPEAGPRSVWGVGGQGRPTAYVRPANPPYCSTEVRVSREEVSRRGSTGAPPPSVTGATPRTISSSSP